MKLSAAAVVFKPLFPSSLILINQCTVELASRSRLVNGLKVLLATVEKALNLNRSGLDGETTAHQTEKKFQVFFTASESDRYALPAMWILL